MKKLPQYLRIPVLLALAMPAFALAGVCKPDGAAKAFDFAFNATFTSPEENTHQKLLPNAHSWNLGGDSYSGFCGCSKPGQQTPSAILYTTSTDLAKGYTAMVNGTEMQFYKVNRNIQVAAEVYVGGGVDKYVPLPLTKLSNGTTHYYNCPSDGQLNIFFNTGRQGHLHLMIDKPFIGESVIPRTKLFDLRAALEQSDPSGGQPLVNVWMSGSVIVPQSCELAPGQVTTIDFGSLNPWELAAPGESPQRSVSRTFKVQCKNMSEMVAINLSLEGAPHTEQTNALAVNDRSDLAIILKNNGRIVPPLREFATPKPENLIPLTFNQAEQKGEFDLEAYPIKAEKYVEPGEFKSQVTVKFEFE